MKALAPIGRLLFSAIFIVSGINHLQNREAMTGYAESMGLPLAGAAVVLTGLMILVGGVLVLLGVATRFGAALIATFLVATALTMHAFWTIDDPQASAMQMAHFMKNLSMAGGAFLLMYFGPGPVAISTRSKISEPTVHVPLRERFGEP